MAWQIKKGCTATQDILIKDKDGEVVDNLAEATEIKFQVKEAKEDEAQDAKITKTKDDGIAVNQPRVGYLRLTLVPSDTGIAVGTYFMGLQIKWSDDEVYEVALKIEDVTTEQLEIIQDVVS